MQKLEIKSMKGQVTLIAIVLTIITVIAFAAMLPILNQAIDLLKNNTNDTTIQFIADLYPLILALGILIAIVTFTTVQRPVE